jgi:aminoacyl tRNA synthase complex-interacting multifunctional protein 1
LKTAEYYGIPSVTRYFDHIQSAPAIRSSAASFGDSYSIIPFNLQDAPKLERNPEAGKKVKSVKTTTTTTTQNSEAVAETSVRTSDKKPQKEKGKKKEKADAAPSSNAVATKKQGTAPADDDGEPVPSMIDLRVGRIVDSKAFPCIYLKPILNLFVVMKHPDADSLYVEVSPWCFGVPQLFTDCISKLILERRQVHGQ